MNQPTPPQETPEPHQPFNGLAHALLTAYMAHTMGLTYAHTYKRYTASLEPGAFWNHIAEMVFYGVLDIRNAKYTEAQKQQKHTNSDLRKVNRETLPTGFPVVALGLQSATRQLLPTHFAGKNHAFDALAKTPEISESIR